MACSASYMHAHRYTVCTQFKLMYFLGVHQLAMHVGPFIAANLRHDMKVHLRVMGEVLLSCLGRLQEWMLECQA